MNPSWLSLATTEQRADLMHLLATAGRSREEWARHMLAAPPQPTDAADARARAETVIRYLTGCGYVVGDRHPSTMEKS